VDATWSLHPPPPPPPPTPLISFPLQSKFTLECANLTDIKKAVNLHRIINKKFAVYVGAATIMFLFMTKILVNYVFLSHHKPAFSLPLKCDIF